MALHSLTGRARPRWGKTPAHRKFPDLGMEPLDRSLSRSVARLTGAKEVCSILLQVFPPGLDLIGLDVIVIR